MTAYQGPGVQRRVGKSAESTLLTLGILAFVIVVLSAVTLVPRGTSTAASGGTGSVQGLGSQQPGVSGGSSPSLGGVSGGSSPSLGGVSGGSSPSLSSSGGGGGGGAYTATGSSRPGTTTNSGRTTGSGQTTTGSGQTTTASGQTTTGSGQTTTGSGQTTTNSGSVACSGSQNGGSTDTGVTGNSIKIGAVTVDSGPGATFLEPEDTAMKAETAAVNRNGGVCGRQISLDLHDSGWNASTGATDIENEIQADNVFALAVNPDSEGLNAVSVSPYGNGKLDGYGVPVIGTDGLLYSQYADPHIWPIAASTVTAMHSMAVSQHKSGATSFSIVYEETYRFGREGANAYDHEVKALTGKDIAGYSDPNTNPQCQSDFCGIQSNQETYGSQASTMNSASTGAGAVLLEPATAIQWFKSGGAFGAAKDPSGGKGAAPQPLFQTYFATSCQQTCNQMRLWTGFIPPIGSFASQPAVAQYVNTMKAYSSSVDVDNQFAEGGYLGMLLTVQVLTAASTAPHGLTRSNVIAILDNTQNWNNGLSVSPLSWSSGDHFAETSVIAFDELYPSGFGGWQYISGSQTQDSNPTHI